MIDTLNSFLGIYFFPQRLHLLELRRGEPPSWLLAEGAEKKKIQGV